MAQSEISDLSETDSSNTTISDYSTDGNIANMSTTDNVFQAILGMLKRWFKTSLFRLRDGTDQTKLLAFNLANITTATTRTLTAPNRSGLLMVGPTSTDNAVVRFDGVIGDVQNSGVLIDDSNRLSAAALAGGATAGATYILEATQATGSIVGLIKSTGSASARLYFKNTGMTTDGDTQFNAINNDLAVNTNGTEKARFLQAGGIAAGATGLPAVGTPGAFLGSPDVSASRTATAVSTATTHQVFINPNGTVGSISTASSATTYATSSDQRLKEHFEDFDAGKIIDAIKIYEYRWKSDGSTGYGPKAQELYEVFPNAVAPGNGFAPGDDDFMPWGWDASKVVPVLIRELQSVRARLATIEGK